MKTCFFITPIGEKNSPDRQRSDFLFNYLLETVFKKHNINVIRADKINEPTSLNNEIFKNIFFADFVVSDLSNNNPNVFYETAVRHCTGKTIIHIAQEGQVLPFDIKDFYTIFVNHSDANSLKEAEKKLDEIIKRSIAKPEVENLNPVTISAKINNINVNFYPSQSKDSLLNDVRDTLSKVVAELQDIKPLIKNNSINETSIWTGKWMSNLGIIDLIEDGNYISGEYQYYSKEYIGIIKGYLINDIFFFDWNWKDNSFKGFGFWNKANDTDFLEGRYFYANRGNRTEIIELIKKGRFDEISDDVNWIIYGKIA